MSTASLQPSSTSARKGSGVSTANDGGLDVTIFSLYDLPSRHEPTGVSVTACGITVASGPPTSRHKDRNSFKFSSGMNELHISEKLKELYQTSVTVKILYSDRPALNMEADYALNQLCINEDTWLILNLEGPNSNGTKKMEENSDEEPPPSIRIRLRLHGPYRPEIAAIVTMCQGWFGIMDHVEENAKHALSAVPRLPSIKSVPPPMLLVPAVPLVTLVVVFAPVLVGGLIVSLPVFLPLLVGILTIIACLGGAGLMLYASTSGGRKHVSGVLEPVVNTVFTKNPAAQTFLYETGPRATPVSLVKPILPTSMWNKLLVSLAIDLVGSSSYLLPIVGEVFDVSWAPLQTTLIMAMYDTTSPNLKYVSFVEEILPFTDVVPSATIGWFMEFIMNKSNQGQAAIADVVGLYQPAKKQK